MPVQRLLLVLLASTLFIGCRHADVALDKAAPKADAAMGPVDAAVAPGPEVFVANEAELSAAIAEAGPGTTIVMADGVWADVQIRFVGEGTAEQPVTLRAETPGGVRVQGQSDLKLGGAHLIVDGLYFTEGASPSNAVIQFSTDDRVANHSRVTNCVIDGFNKAQRNQQDLWVLFEGRHNQMDRCYLAGKSNRGPTVRVDLKGNEHIYNYHRITDNHFGPRPPKGGPSAETIQIGDSGTSMAPSHTLVANNFFDRCDGEVEVISSKANFNEFRNNVFYLSEGSLVTRHGNYAFVDGNYFIGDGESPYYGGIRLIGTGHWVVNNFFFGLRGDVFRAPLAVMNGIPRSAINRYFQVTDVVVAHNTWVNTRSPWQFGVGSNIDQKDVLPPSEIRSETPTRTLLANNIIYNTDGDPQPIVRHDAIDGVTFRNNLIDNQNVPFDGVDGLRNVDLTFTEVEPHVWVPTTDLSGYGVHRGFEFERIADDLFGRARSGQNAVGATNGVRAESPNILDDARYGPDWYTPETHDSGDTVVHAVGTAAELARAVAQAASGDVIELAGGEYTLSAPLRVDKRLTVRSADAAAKARLVYTGPAGTPAFEMQPGGDLRLATVELLGNRTNYAFAPLRENMSSSYNLTVEDAEIAAFDAVLKAHKYSFAQRITFENTTVRDSNNGLELASEDDDRGDYNAEHVHIIDSRFDNVSANVIDYYRGGYDESTVGGTLVVRGTTFTNSGSADEGGLLIDTYGIINVALIGNTFRDNAVELVARLWGAKNNTHADNVIENSGDLIVEQNLPQKLVY